jgi:hypothetical protein
LSGCSRLENCSEFRGQRLTATLNSKAIIDAATKLIEHLGLF